MDVIGIIEIFCTSQRFKESNVIMNNDKIKIFENKKIRTVWSEKDEQWYFSVADVCEAISESDRPRKYWSDLKIKLKAEGSELSDKIGQFKI